MIVCVQCSGATYGSCIKVNGTLIPSDHDKQPVEVRAESIHVLGSCDTEVIVYFVAVFTSYTFKNCDIYTKFMVSYYIYERL